MKNDDDSAWNPLKIMNFALKVVDFALQMSNFLCSHAELECLYRMTSRLSHARTGDQRVDSKSRIFDYKS